MGTAWSGVSESQFQTYERRMLSHTGIPLQNFEIFNVIIDNKRNYVRTVRVGLEKNPPMVLIHGYGGSGIMFWQIIKPLADKYNLFVLDVLGYGGSKLWRKQIDLEKFILVGHSFGGYLCGIYASRYPYRVKKLQLLSPAGIGKQPENYEVMMQLEYYQKKIKPMFDSKLEEYAWNGVYFKYYEPQAEDVLIVSLVAMQVEIFLVFQSLTNLIINGSSEYSIYKCLNYDLFAIHPLEEDDRLGGIQIPVSIFYGDRDWMPQEGALNVINKNPYRGTHSHFHIIKNSNHHLYFDNPDELSKKILKDLENINEIDDVKSQKQELITSFDKNNEKESMYIKNEIDAWLDLIEDFNDSKSKMFYDRQFSTINLNQQFDYVM
ncbi:UNKNOWN [Stylonychia lemnae]|uniref:AB hydrolase-1 domain-containing protein n=1 Tax=Stylonychia lemnae TaxID=5949 RepID=A0A078AJT1_STYLE|nr:UNKNOWN [Stylonychia lemnae]|eukprot:CDW82640.1 UNKNOWN [Stylonychia lemnae]